jgi:hypothetical protein
VFPQYNHHHKLILIYKFFLFGLYLYSTK